MITSHWKRARSEIKTPKNKIIKVYSALVRNARYVRTYIHTRVAQMKTRRERDIAWSRRRTYAHVHGMCAGERLPLSLSQEQRGGSSSSIVRSSIERRAISRSRAGARRIHEWARSLAGEHQWTGPSPPRQQRPTRERCTTILRRTYTSEWVYIPALSLVYCYIRAVPFRYIAHASSFLVSLSLSLSLFSPPRGAAFFRETESESALSRAGTQPTHSEREWAAPKL